MQSMKRSGALGRLVTGETFAILGLAFVAAGVSYTSLWSGPQSVLYYGLIGLGALACVPMLLARDGATLMLISVISALPVMITSLHVLAPNGSQPDLLLPAGIGLVIVLSAVAGCLSHTGFQRLMTAIAVTHLPILFLALHRSPGGIAQMEMVNRLGMGTLSPAVLAELAVGLFLASLLSGRISLISVSAVTAGAIIVETQMRGAGLALFVSAFVWMVGVAQKKLGTAGLLAIAFMFAGGALLLHKQMTVWLSAALLLDDHHRGIASGLAGRFDNWHDGIQRFAEAPFFGNTQSDVIASYTHNGFIKLLAEFGLALFLPLFILLALAARRAWSEQQLALLAAIAGYVFFLGSAPRYLNFQLMPLVGTMAIAAALLRPGTAQEAGTASQAPVNKPSFTVPALR